MSLHGWQTALSEMVIAQAAGATPALDQGDSPAPTGRPATELPARVDIPLTEAERAWLSGLAATPGFKVTCEIQRWWREFRVQSAAPLTLALLGPGRREAVVAAFVSRNPKPSSFYIREALPFLEAAAELAADVPHLPELAAFERAMLLLGQALASGQAFSLGQLDPGLPLAAHPLAAGVRFKARPDRVLAAAARGLPLPPEERQAHWLLVAPLLPNLARTCTAEEAGLFEALRESPARLRPSAALASLWQTGALRHAA
jgi:hypothetical protein